jgi:heme/copper-type cytochrome/quinol oxidase subunit 2
MLPIVLLLAAVAAHEATPVDQLKESVRFVREVPATPKDFQSDEAKSFRVIARRFEFDFTPAPFVVNVGDSVSLSITADDGEHGFFVESFMTEGVAIREKETVTVNFVASTAGTFTYFCTVVCGEGHLSMNGRLTVVAPETLPSITSFTPASGSTAGGAVVAITGTNFQNGATVRFGDIEAVSTIVNSPTSIIVFTPARTAGSVTIVVRNPDGKIATSSSTYTFGPPPPPSRKRRAVKGK